jgi:L-ribulose-5-phosphate 3-epimerase UlaE
LLDIVDQSPKVIMLEVVRDALDLGCRTFNIAGYSLLILFAQLLARLP